MLGVAIRIAERIGIHDEGLNAKCLVLEAETRRRLWWSLSTFDTRICEISGYKMKVQAFAEDGGCKLPLNVNDFDIRPEMQTPPEAYTTPTEALFTVVRSELSDSIRRLLLSSKDAIPSVEAAQAALENDIERRLEEKYFRFCNPQNPLHFLTIWTTQSVLSKMRLILQFSLPTPRVGSPQEDSQRAFAFEGALNALEADTKLITSTLTKGFSWFLNLYFPFPAYVHLVQDLKERPLGEHAEKAWQLMTENMAARSEVMQGVDHLLVRVFVKRILQVWDIREAALSAGPNPQPVEIPSLVSHFRQIMAQWSNNPSPKPSTKAAGDPVQTAADSVANTTQLETQTAFDNLGLPYTTSIPASASGFTSDPFPDPFAQPTMDFATESTDWNTMYWTRMSAAGWW